MQRASRAGQVWVCAPNIHSGDGVDAHWPDPARLFANAIAPRFSRRKDMSHSASFGAEVLEPRQLLASAYAVDNLVSDGATPARFVDKNLVNPWGLVVGPFGVRVADNGSSSTTAYNG